MTAIKIVLVDDHQIVLDGLRLLLDQDPTFEVIASFTHPDKVLPFLEIQQPDIVLTDYSLPTMNGLELIGAIKSKYPSLKCALLSMHDEPSVVRQAMKSSIDGYLLKNIPKAGLKEALQKIHDGLVYISPEITTKFIHVQSTAEDTSLTDREMDVLEWIIKEQPNKNIADKLHISERTVETHRKNIFRKTGTNNLVGLMKYVYENKLIK